MIGKMLGNRYELLEKIGEGGMAEVYKAKCHSLNRFVAVKILKAEYSSDKDFVEKFKREATAAASLSDNNIVTIYDVGTEDGINYIVMEYVKGKTLKDIIREKRRLSNEETVEVAIQIAKALSCAHKNNIIHRDIKPHNIMVTEDGMVKVTDFGIAKASNSVTITNTSKVLGSAHYFSPEQAKGSYVDFRTDIYSLGIVIYEMITGRVPFNADSPVSVALKHIQETPVPPKDINSSIPNSLNNLILKAIEKEPIKRYQSIKEMLSDLEKIKNDWNYNIPITTFDNDETRVMDPVNIEDEYEEDDEDKIKKPMDKKKKRILILSISVVLVFVLGILAAYFAFKGTGSKGDVAIPNIVGLKSDEAKKLVEAKGLKFLVVDNEKSDKPAGTITRCNPEEGTMVKSGSTVRVYVSGGASNNTVPDLKEININTAKDILKSDGITLGNVTYEFNDTIEKDNIIRQTPDPDTPVDSSTKVDLVVSKGPETPMTTVPKLKGLTYDQAVAALKNSNLSAGTVTYIQTKDKTQDTVVQSSNPQEGSSVKQGTSVALSVYKYGAKVPNLIGSSKADATHKITNAGFTVGTVNYTLSLPQGISVGSGQVCAQSVKADSNADPGASIDITVYIHYIKQKYSEIKNNDLSNFIFQDTGGNSYTPTDDDVVSDEKIDSNSGKIILVFNH